MIACVLIDVIGWTTFGGFLGMVLALLCILFAQRKV